MLPPEMPPWRKVPDSHLHFSIIHLLLALPARNSTPGKTPLQVALTLVHPLLLKLSLPKPWLHSPPAGWSLGRTTLLLCPQAGHPWCDYPASSLTELSFICRVSGWGNPEPHRSPSAQQIEQWASRGWNFAPGVPLDQKASPFQELGQCRSLPGLTPSPFQPPCRDAR